MKQTLQLLAVAAAVLLIGLLVYEVSFVEPPKDGVVIEFVQGPVEIERAGARAPASPGEELEAAQRLVSGEGGQAVLAIGEESRLTLESESTLKILGQDESGVKVELEEGRIQATVRPGSALSVLADGREINATDADFAAALRGGGAAVEVSRGALALNDREERMEIRAGERAVSAAGGPMRKSDVPQELLLQVAWPVARTREEEVTLEGETEPGARVRVKLGAEVLETTADADGRFSVRVPLSSGENPVLVEASGLLGDERSSARAIVRDDRGPTADFEIRY